MRDLTPLYRSTVGFDRAARLMEGARRMDGGTNYPPYDIEAIGENGYAVTLAVAGFEADDLTVEVRDGMLVVAGRKASETDADADTDEPVFLHRGIATRDFLRKFHLADHVKVTGAGLENGLLRIDLVREVPEAKAPRKVAIATGAPETAVA
ncbi:16 kDa heat shock protein A [Caenispirillum salinarum AK4]|uniref:16 kDa heat shock protein A n=1 Tax=Caenispirillum salinarum AK4 TaxID=1238182 RepID=K9H6P4_9PROT|nr:Hsp20 family protein [Caenispirillum salinarum]EKV26283.1 16 kDa heat shock protein A [Caenispirillum salinarum AK4]